MADGNFKINTGVSLNPQSGTPTNPINGDLYYSSSLGTFVFYDNGVWINLASRTDVASATNLTSANFTATVTQNPFVRITGSTSGNIHGLTATTDGFRLILYNQSSVTMIIKFQSTSEPTAVNRIITMTGADVTLGSGIMAMFVYDASQQRWIADTFATGQSVSGLGTDGAVDINPGTQSPFTLSSSNSGQIFLVNSANGAMTFNLPSPATGLIFTFKDIAGQLATNKMTLHRFASESIENVAADYVMAIPYSDWTLTCDGTNWYFATNGQTIYGPAAAGKQAINPGTQSPFSLATYNSGQLFLVNSANGAMQFNLPTPVANLTFTIKDIAGQFGGNPCTIHRFASESIENVASDYVLYGPYGKWSFFCDGTNWYIVTE